MKAKINKRFLATVKAPEHGEARYYDEDFPNFGLVVYPSGRSRYFYFYSFQRKRRQDKLSGDITPLKAKEWARAIQARVAMGEDPRGPAQVVTQVSDRPQVANLPDIPAQNDSPVGGQGMVKTLGGDRVTFMDLAEAFEVKVMPTYRSQTTRENYRRYIERLLPKIGAVQLSKLEKRHIVDLRDGFGRIHGERTAGQMVTMMSRMFNLGMEWGFPIQKNPCEKVTRHNGNIRCRILNNTEIVALQDSIGQETNPYIRGLFRLLFFTLARKGEVVSLKWDDIDFEMKTWLKPITKNGQPQLLPLIPQAIETLKGIPRMATNPYVFCGRRPGSHLTKSLSKQWARVTARAKVENVTIHDIRRSMASWLLNNGVSMALISKLLNHSSVRVTESVYAKFDLSSQRQGVEQLEKLFG